MGDALEQAEDLVARFVDAVVAHRPVEATGLGDHRRDHDLPDLAPDALDAWERALDGLRREAVAQLDALDGEGTAGDAVTRREARGDLQLLLDGLDQRLFWLRDRPRLQTDPLAVLDVASGSLHELLRRRDVDRETQARFAAAAVARARRFPRLLEQAGRLLEGASEPHLRVAEQRLRGLLEVVGEALPARVEELGGDRTAALDAGAVATEGLEAFGALLAGLTDAPRPDWRLGPELHAPLLRAAVGTSLDVEDVRRRAEAWLAEMRADLAERAGRLWSRLVPGEPLPDDEDERIRRTLAAVADVRAVERGGLIEAARSAVGAATAWTRDAGIVDVPPDELLTITEVPGYLQGVAVAFIQPAPSLEPEAGSIFYLSAVPGHWDDGRAASFLREYNRSQLEGLALHEAVPGHFVQLEHAARHPRLARRLLFSSAFAEGWAVDIERHAVSLGYGDDLYRLVQRKLECRIAVNALLDVSLHAGDMDDDGAMALMTGRAFQEEAEAGGKLVRAKVTAGQLSSYFVGGAEMGDLRAEVTAARGASFDVRRYHQQLLSHGTPTVAIAREAVLCDDPVERRPFA